MNLADLTAATVADVAALPVSVHATLANEYAELQERTKRIGAVLDAALQQAYGGQNAPGTSHIEREGYSVKVNVPKRVEWSADALQDMSADDTLLEWMEWKPSVAESKYKAMPERIQKQFDTARTVKLGKPAISFSKKEG